MRFEAAVDEFLVPWRKRRQVVGALITGSYVTGSPSAHSDLDLNIVLAEGTAWQERGNRIVQGYLVEYFVNPPEQTRKYFHSDRESHRLITATMYATGEIVFDLDGSVARLVREARKSLRTPFPRLAPKRVEVMKYLIWDSLDNLGEFIFVDYVRNRRKRVN